MEDKVKIAIDRIRYLVPEEGYYVAFSGGKDSVVIFDLVKRSGVKYDAHYNITGIDPPELFYFIRDKFPEVKRHRPEKTIWQLIEDKRMPPTRKVRYCCAELKERGGADRRVLTGIRWAESARRGKRRMTEVCFRNARKTYLHPVIDWSDSDVWQYIKENKLAYCKLYDEGFKRLGCIGCPISGTTQKKELERWPAYYRLYVRSFDKCLEKRRKDGLKTTWTSGEQMMSWWLDNAKHRVNPDQEVMFE